MATDEVLYVLDWLLAVVMWGLGFGWLLFALAIISRNIFF